MKKKKRSSYTSKKERDINESTPTEEPNNRDNPDIDAEEGVEVLDAPDDDFEAKYNDAQDRYTRVLAEFDNFRKRSVKEKSAQYDAGVDHVAEKLLPIIDNFERAMNAGEVTHGNDSFYQGIALIARQFTQMLEDLHITEIDASRGTEFDPNFHNAVAIAEDDGLCVNQIAEVLQKGYLHKEKVLRHAMVRVAGEV